MVGNRKGYGIARFCLIYKHGRKAFASKDMPKGSNVVLRLGQRIREEVSGAVWPMLWKP